MQSNIIQTSSTTGLEINSMPFESLLNSYTSIDLNAKIKVYLTEFGKEVYKHRFDDCEDIDNEFVSSILSVYPEVDEEGKTEFQLWEFMNIYGKHLVNGATQQVIKPLRIYIERSELEQTSMN